MRSPFKLRRPIPATLLALAAVVPAALLAPPPTGAQIFGLFGKNKITYQKVDWKIYHSPHFDVYHYEEEGSPLLPKIVSMAESAYDRLSRRLDFQIQEPTTLIVYATHSHFEQNNIIQNFIPEGMGAFATPVRFRMVMPADLPDPELFELMMHELTHIFEYHILFGGSLGRALAQQPPTWMMEGFASYMAQDEGSWEKMHLRDAVVNDAIPPISRVDFQGYMAYRFGHAVFDFMEERWGEEGVQDFIYELRNTIGFRADRAIKRAFRIEPEDFDTEFRRWLRQRYLPELVATGEPLDFGRPFRAREAARTVEASAVASPSGDLVAAFSTVDGDVDVVLFDTRRRRFLRNLTKGFTTRYEYLIGQNLTVARVMGRDLAFSADGDRVAVFARREGGRSLVLLDVLTGSIDRVIDLDHLGLEQQLAPAFSPDGRKVAFSAWRAGHFDVFAYDLTTGELTNLTGDDLYNGAPAYAPDGGRIVFSSVLDGYQKLFELDLATGVRRQLSFGDSNERDAVFAPGGGKLYFSSDRTGAENVYSVDLATGRLVQHTNAVTGCFMPTVFEDADGREQLVYTGFWRQTMSLYLADPEKALGELAPAAESPPPAAAAEPPGAGGLPEPRESEPPPPEPEPFVVIGGPPAAPGELPRFEPDIEVAIDPANQEPYRGFSLFLEEAETFAAIDSEGTVLGQLFISFSDNVGDRRVQAIYTSVYSFSDIEIYALDSSRRIDRVIRLHDSRRYFVGRLQTGQLVRRGLIAESGLTGYLVYPIDLYHRVEAGAGFRYRDVGAELTVENRRTGEVFVAFEPRTDGFPVVELALVGDTVRFAEFGPHAGRRWRVGGAYAPDLSESGTLTWELSLDARQYIPLTRRSELAFRVVGATSDGEITRPYFIGGLNQLRGVPIWSEVGDRAFYGNAELRFPLIDRIDTAAFRMAPIRGNFFFDIGGAYFKKAQPDWKFFDSDDNRLLDGLASYGFGVSTYLLGLPVNWSFSKRWDLKDTLSDFDTSFWIGFTF